MALATRSTRTPYVPIDDRDPATVRAVILARALLRVAQLLLKLVHRRHHVLLRHAQHPRELVHDRGAAPEEVHPARARDGLHAPHV